jgi:hypothetical protein
MTSNNDVLHNACKYEDEKYIQIANRSVPKKVELGIKNGEERDVSSLEYIANAKVCQSDNGVPQDQKNIVRG